MVPTFNGESGNTIEVINWLDRVMALARQHDLNYATSIELLKVCSSGGASLYIRQLQKSGSTLKDIVRALETRYGDLCTPEDAHIKCNTMPRKDGEYLTAFLDRLRSMAEIATRLVANEAEKNRQVEAIIVRNMPRVLPPSVRMDLENRMLNLSRSGLRAMTSIEMEKECLDLERRRNERRNLDRGRHSGARAVQADNASEHSSSETDSDNGRDEYEVYANAVRSMEKRYQNKGRVPKFDKIFRRAQRRVDQWKARRPGQANYAQGPPDKLPDKPQKSFTQMLADAKVERGECLQCGQAGHNARSDQCGLRGKPLVDRACAKCGKGLHNPDDCPRVYQRQSAVEALNDQ
jgi:hypothetical protein